MNHADTHVDLQSFLEADIVEAGRLERMGRALNKHFLQKLPNLSTLRKWRAELLTNVYNRIRHRSLVIEILLLQLLSTIAIGLLAVGVLWMSSSQAIDNNMRNWGEQWLVTLDDISMPLYLSNDADSYLRVEEYANKFPEIVFVRFYDDTGEIIFEDFDAEGPEPTAPLTAIRLMSLIDLMGKQHQTLIDTSGNDEALMRIGKPIWTESLAADGLLGLDLTDETAVDETLVGFVELGLNSGIYQAELEGMLGVSMYWGFGLLLLMGGASWATYRRALRPLSDLRVPLKRLAEGHTEFEVEASGHQEIAAIADALNTTVGALHERDKKLRFLASHDPLTGLINRHKLMELLEAEIEGLFSADITSALLFIDLDHFKYVNDTAGHAAGDRLLQEVAGRLLGSVREQDAVARFGGDEFVVLLSGVDEKQAREICTSLIKEIGDHSFVEKDKVFTIRCSIGAGMIRNQEFCAADFLSQVDMACHKAKNIGRNRFEFYESSSDTLTGMANEISLSRKINHALKNDDFVLQYQPIIDIRNGEPSHFEVLVRMRVRDNKGRRKLCLPDAFIPAAVRFDLMIHIDRWVLRNAIEQLAIALADNPNTRFTLNVSGKGYSGSKFSKTTSKAKYNTAYYSR